MLCACSSVSKSRPGTRPRDERGQPLRAGERRRPSRPAMTSGMRASSIRIESASSTRAKWYARCDALDRLEREGVAQVVEARLLGGEVRDVGGVGPLPLGDAHPLLHEADGEPQPLVDRPHPRGVAPGEVVVEGEDVGPAAGQGVEEDGRDRGERLALAGRHLRDLPLGEGEAGQDLLVERPLPEGAACRLAGEGEGLGKLRFDGRPVRDADAEGAGPLRQTPRPSAPPSRARARRSGPAPPGRRTSRARSAGRGGGRGRTRGSSRQSTPQNGVGWSSSW